MRANHWIENRKERLWIAEDWLEGAEQDILDYIVDYVHVECELRRLCEILAEKALSLAVVKEEIKKMKVETLQERAYFKEMLEEVILLKIHDRFHTEDMTGIRCQNCGCWLPSYTKGHYHQCGCKELAVDGTEYYTRILTNQKKLEILPAYEVLERWE